MLTLPAYLITFLLVLIPLEIFAQNNPSAEITTAFTEPYETSEVAAAEPGVVAQIHVREGDTVVAGQSLGELDKQVLIESRRLAKAKVDSTARISAAKTVLMLRQTQRDDFEALIEKGHANASEMNRVNSEFEAARAEYQLALDEAIQNKIELARNEAQLKRRDIVSPMDGVVTEIHRRRGEYLASTEPQFATVVMLSQLRVRFYLRAGRLDQLAVGQTVTVSLGDKRESTTATIEYVSPIIDPDSGTGRVDVVIDNKERQIRSGTVCRWEEKEEGGQVSR